MDINYNINSLKILIKHNKYWFNLKIQVLNYEYYVQF